MIRIMDLRYRTLDVKSLSIGTGVTSVIGANGSGKTSLLKLCTGIALPESGTIRIDGSEPRQVEIGWVHEFPDRNFLFDTVSDEVASALRFRHFPPTEITGRTTDVLARIGIAPLSTRSVRELSGGEKILVALAAALNVFPQVLILDECDSHLDSHTAALIDGLIRRSDIPYILRCTQDMETAAGSDQLIFLEQGRARFSGTPANVFSSLEETPFYPMTWRCRV
jgi:energy-coupling factor transport system ATP-binding protein